jgi:hypothetical protein
MRVHVTPTDIKNGDRSKPCSCPIALALKRQKCTHVKVYDTYTVFRDNHNLVGFYTLPLKAQGFVRAFDEGSTVEPIIFTINC